MPFFFAATYITTGFNITQAYIAPGIAYKINKKSIAKYNENVDNEDKLLIEISDREKDDFIRRAIYGGRCLPGIKEFINNQYEKILMEVLQEENITGEEFINLEDVIYDDDKNKKENLTARTKNNINRKIASKINYNDIYNSRNYYIVQDVKSLYPTAMAGTNLLNVNFPNGLSRWSNIPEEEFKNNKI